MREQLAHVQFRGTIRERSVDPFVRMLRHLQERKRVKGVLLDISSGGGGDIASTDLYLAVKRLDQVKPVVASIGALGASGAYMAALGARKVYAYPGSGVGSIGVVMPHIAVKGLLDKLGVDVEMIHAGRHKDAYQGLRTLTDEERTKLLAVTTDSYDSFVDLVARERKRPVEEIRALATGEFWSGKQALRLGLVDALGDREEALTELGRITGVRTSRTVLVAPPRPFLERFFSGGLTSLGEGLSLSVHDAIEDAVLDAIFLRR
jgi:protease IV